jgi:protein-disulfide isomerase
MSTLKIPIGDQDHIEGNVKAACTLVEYGDYECPHCGAAYPLVKQLEKHFGKRLRFVYRNFPLTQIHANAHAAAEAAEFAGTKGKFWKMHDLLFDWMVLNCRMRSPIRLMKSMYARTLPVACAVE